MISPPQMMSCLAIRLYQVPKFGESSDSKIMANNCQQVTDSLTVMKLQLEKRKFTLCFTYEQCHGTSTEMALITTAD